MKQAHPIRLAIIVAALVLSILALQPTKSTDLAITGGNPSSKLTLLSNGSAFQNEFYNLRIEGSGNIGESKNLTLSVLDKQGHILKDNISIGEGYQTGQALGGGEIPSFSLSEGAVATGTSYEISYLVQYMDLGLDLVGGSEIEYRIPMEQMNEKKVELSDIVELFNRKLNNSGLKEIFVQAVGQDRVLVQLPGLKKSEVENIKKVIEQQGNLEFKIVENDPKLIEQAQEYIQKGKTLPLANFPYEFIAKTFTTPEGLTQAIPGSQLLVQGKTRVTGKDIVHAYKGLDTQSLSGGYSIHINFSGPGAGKFGDLTEQSRGKRLAIVLDGSLQSAPNINEPILGGQCQITGSFSEEEANNLVAVLRSGSMDVKPELLTENTVGPTLGSDSIQSGIKACLLGGIAVLAFMILYYKGLGIIANLALILNMLMLFGAMALFGGTLTLPGIAGFALTIGMAVDATVLIFERLREENSKKQAIKATLVKSYQRAFITIFDSNFTTFITALILYWVGNSAPVKGFCLSLMLGLAINLFAAVFVTQTLLSTLVQKRKITAFKFNNPLFNKSEVNFFPIGKKVIFMISYPLLIVGAILTVMRGSETLDVDFTGGNLLQIELNEPKQADSIRDIVSNAGYPSAVVQSFGDKQGTSYTLRTPPLSQTQKKSLQNKLSSELPLPQDSSLAFPRDITVGGVAAKEMLGYALIALIAAMLVILMYIMIRFSEFKYGLGACVALIHDIGITLSLLALCGIQINLTIFAALLTVVGYSLNDTIVIFDRIRENIGVQKKYDFKTIATRSLNQTLNRTLLTSVTTLFVIGSLVIVGGGVIEDFAITMLFGVLTGTYSSLFVATPFVAFLHRKDKNSQTGTEIESEPTPIKADPMGTV